MKNIIVDKIPETARYIEGTKDYYADIDGSIYCINHRNHQPNYIIKVRPYNVYGYLSCGINYMDKRVNRRIHRIIAETFIPNPDNLPLVGHKNNIKDDNRVDNLYWTTASENTQKAFDDGLAIPVRGPKSVTCYNPKTHEPLMTFNSCRAAAKVTGINHQQISRESNNLSFPKDRCYFRYVKDSD